MKNSIRLMAVFFVLLLFSEGFGHEKTVLLSILVKNKAHVLPHFFQYIDNQDYPKELISVYINTNDNVDNSLEIIQKWIDDHRHEYRQVVLDVHESDIAITNPHDWNSERFAQIGRIRNKSLQKTLELGCDYYFVVDCDNFIAPYTLPTLIDQDKPIVAPLLTPTPFTNQRNRNFFADVDANGYYVENPFFFPISEYHLLGTHKVPLVHHTYLIKADVINKLNYIDASTDYEFIIFARTARNNGVEQYICNTKDFGTFLDSTAKVTLDDERYIVNKLIERQKCLCYANPKFPIAPELVASPVISPEDTSPISSLAKARAYQKIGFNAEAIEEYNQYIQHCPDHEEFHNAALERAVLLSKTGLDTQDPCSEKTVFMSIFAKDDAHLLPLHLLCIEKLDYDKKLITLHIDVRNSSDETRTIIEDWLSKHGKEYQNVLFRYHFCMESTADHTLQFDEVGLNARVREESFQLAKQSGSNFYFTVDTVCMLAPNALKILVQKDEPIIAPLLRVYPNTENCFSNYFCGVTENGYYKDHPFYFPILHREVVGTFPVPLVHSTYLIQTKYLDSLAYSDSSNDYESVIFGRYARRNHIPQLICNEEMMGVLLLLDRPTTQETRTKSDVSRAYAQFFEAHRIDERDLYEQVYSDLFEENDILSGHMPMGNKRYITFKRAFEMMKKRDHKTVVETGTARAGITKVVLDGASTYFFASWAQKNSGHLYSVDVLPEAVQAAARSTKQFSDSRSVVCDDSVHFLAQFDQPIDFLYLDSFDLDLANPYPSQIHHLKEIEAAYDKLHKNSVVMIDDCDLPHGGKGKLAINFLLARGWKIIEDRYQVILAPDDRCLLAQREREHVKNMLHGKGAAASLLCAQQGEDYGTTH